MCTVPGEDSHNVGWMTPFPLKVPWSRGTKSVASQVLPWSTEMSTKASQASHNSLSTEDGASQLPSVRTIILFFTGPLMVSLPGTRSLASVQEDPPSSEWVTRARQEGIDL